MRSKIVAGNWKMNLSSVEISKLVKEVANQIIEGEISSDTKIVFGPAFPYLALVREILDSFHLGNILLAAQNCSEIDSGARTGETSVGMLKDVGCDLVIIGHSERRKFHKESNELLKLKVDKSLEHGLPVIFCIGETLEEREQEKLFEVIESQVSEALFHLSAEDLSKIVLAYEPVWAIGTGVTASPEQAQEMHQFIRLLIDKKYGFEVSDKMSILYGGSVKPANAAELFSKPDVDGGLVGGASLKSGDFFEIIKAI